MRLLSSFVVFFMMRWILKREVIGVGTRQHGIKLDKCMRLQI